MKKEIKREMESGFSFFERDTDVVVRREEHHQARTEGAIIMTGLGGIITIVGTHQ